MGEKSLIPFEPFLKKKDFGYSLSCCSKAWHNSGPMTSKAEAKQRGAEIWMVVIDDVFAPQKRAGLIPKDKASFPA